MKFSRAPSYVYCSDFIEGDAVLGLTKKESKYIAECKYGMASAVAVFDVNNDDNTVEVICNLANNDIEKNNLTMQDIANKWESRLSGGMKLLLPDEKLNGLFKFSLSTLIMLVDGDVITPGPFTYHQFWIRDAAFMIHALDKAGFPGITAGILSSLKKRQYKNGYYRSQKGEWDSNGQVLWMIFQHSLLTGNYDLFTDNYNPLVNGIKWIEKTRLIQKKYFNEPFYGLLPSGLSAEHLGLADFYFWDNFWSIAGISAFIEMCNETEQTIDTGKIKKLLDDYRNSVNSAIKKVQLKFGLNAIPASCTRGLDCGMIGSICASYPLQLFSDGDLNMKATLDTIYNNYFYKGMFFQNVIHSGMNAYLTLQTAHAYLFLGDREKFWEMLTSVASQSSDTLNYPEAIHPFTGGGVMGDGHHGWAAAEIVSALRDAFIFERMNEAVKLKEYVLLAGLPSQWFNGTIPFQIKNAPVYYGTLSIRVIPSVDFIIIETDLNGRNEILSGNKFVFKIPMTAEKILACGKEIPFKCNNELTFSVSPLPSNIIIYRR